MQSGTAAVPQFFGRQAAAYWFSDGLPEIAFGLALANCGAVGFAWAVYFPYWWMRPVLLVAGLCFLALFIWDRKILDLLKKRLTYPRSGYAPPPIYGYPERAHFLTLNAPTVPDAGNNVTGFRGDRNNLTGFRGDRNNVTGFRGDRNNVTGFRMDTVYILFSGSLLVGFFDTRWSVTIAMLAMACLIYSTRRSSEYPYSVWSALALAVTGIPFCAVTFPERAEKFLPLLLGGLWLFCRGAWRMALYLRSNPRPQTAGSRT